MSNVGWNPFTLGGTNMPGMPSANGLPMESAGGTQTGYDSMAMGGGTQSGTYGAFSSGGGYNALSGMQPTNRDGFSPGEVGAIAVGTVAGAGLLAGGVYAGGKKGMNAFKAWRGRAV